MDNTKEILLPHDFRITRLVEVDHQTEEAAKKAISEVWNKHIGEPTTFNLVFASKIIHPKTQKDTGWSEAYDPDADQFQFALDTMEERLRFGIPEDKAIILVAAHSATHKVQFERGDPPRPSPKTKEMDKHYFNDPHEEEAWNEALHVFKKLLPLSSGSFTLGEKKYSIPKESKY